ncbi:MAG: roadblock/LC7 domain-containing protein [candidate division WOR-3 bacterium]|nr:MAG: roadblock/LC7 domain-containing protein [candidate division WOR-3 bacterium]
MQEGINIFEQDFWSINDAMNRLLQGTHAKIILLIDREGQLITSTGDTSRMDTSSFATLSAADFAATSQLASLIGEREFSTLFHQGERENLYVSLVADRIILAVIFDNRTTLGLVRVKTKSTVAELEKIFRGIFNKVRRESGPRKEIDDDFTRMAEEEIDKLFGM